MRPAVVVGTTEMGIMKETKAQLAPRTGEAGARGIRLHAKLRDVSGSGKRGESLCRSATKH